MKRQRRQLGSDFKAKVALAALAGDRTLAQIASQFEVTRVQINQWRKQALIGLPSVFSKASEGPSKTQEALIEDLYKEVGKLKVENEWLKKKARLFAS